MKTKISALLLGLSMFVSGQTTLAYYTETESTKFATYEKTEHANILELFLSKEDCLKNDGVVIGKSICEITAPKVYAETEEIPADYANGELLLSGVSDEVCEKNNGKNMLDSNRLAFCFIPLSMLNMAPSINENGTYETTNVGEYEGIITNEDWNELSMKQIDEKLKKAGKEPIGDPKDPLYTKTLTEIEKITEEDWKKIEKQYEKYQCSETFGRGNQFDAENIWEIFEDPTQGTITDEDWNELSMKQIDEKLKKAGKEPIGDPKDPLYTKTPAEIDKLTNKEWQEIEKQYEKLYPEESTWGTFEDPTKGIITDEDWNKLSMKQIDEKLKKAGKEPIGEPKDPLYSKTPVEIDKLTDKEWKEIEKQYEKLFGTK